MIEHNAENCEKLARIIADEYSLEQLIDFVVEDLYSNMMADPEVFVIELKERGIDKQIPDPT